MARTLDKSKPYGEIYGQFGVDGAAFVQDGKYFNTQGQEIEQKPIAPAVVIPATPASPVAPSAPHVSAKAAKAAEKTEAAAQAAADALNRPVNPQSASGEVGKQLAQE